MENNCNSREIAEIVESSLREFKEGMAHRENPSIRTARDKPEDSGAFSSHCYSRGCSEQAIAVQEFKLV
jgi:hypothetical protein